MEEDIDILEDFIEDEGLYELYRTSHIDLIRKALETLIKGYRELEKENARLGMLNLVQEDMIKELENNSIPKSKIKEKIEELENIKLCSGNINQAITEDKIKLLQELMEDK